MKTNSGKSPSNSVIVNEPLTQKLIKPVMIIVFVIGLTKLGLNYYIDSEENGHEAKNESEVKNITENSLIKRIRIIKQPSCPKSYLLVILEEICTDMKLRKELCGLEDLYNTNKQKNLKLTRKKSLSDEPKAFMNYVVGSLLITSLGAALMELYKAKKQGPKKIGKHPLSRKSSLADLTVMKHQRKELIRRESILELPEESPHTKQLGCNLSSLQRQCSFPEGRNVSSANNTMANVKKATTISNTEARSILISDNRRQSLLDRRTSADYEIVYVEKKRLSLDDSPERKRYRHLVHRH